MKMAEAETDSREGLVSYLLLATLKPFSPRIRRPAPLLTNRAFIFFQFRISNPVDCSHGVGKVIP